jgi:hypothetical protein
MPPVAPVPLILGVLRRREVATVIAHRIPPPRRLGLGVSGEGGISLRVGLREGNRSERVATLVAIAEWLALGWEGVRGSGADSQAYSRRTLGLCLARGLDLGRAAG